MTESTASKPEGQDKIPALLAKGKDDAHGSVKDRGAKAAGSRSVSGLQLLLVLAVLFALVLGGIVWFQYHTYQQWQASTAQQLNKNASAASQADQQVRQLQSQVQLQSDQLTQVQHTVRGLQEQLGDLDQAFQVLTDSGSDLILLNDIDHLVSIANQQITLGGNVPNAIVALETAQARLSRANRPALASLQQTLNGDLERLRGAATVDVSALSGQLEQLNGFLSHAPLLVPDDAVPQVDTTQRNASAQPVQSSGFTADPEAAWWRNGLDAGVYWAGQAWSMLRHDLAGFVSVRRVDDQSALLISPDQADQLRLTLRLRIMTAQLALMMRQPEVWKTELGAVTSTLQSHFDGQSPATQRALRLAMRLADTPVDAKLPALNQTLGALETLRQESSQALEQRRSPSSLDDVTAPRPVDVESVPASNAVTAPESGSDAVTTQPATDAQG